MNNFNTLTEINETDTEMLLKKEQWEAMTDNFNIFS